MSAATPSEPTIENVPASLRSLPQWVLWRRTTRPGREGDKPTKIPYAVDGTLASSTDRSTWSSIDDAVRTLSESRDSQHTYDGVGFAFSPDDPYCGIDLDDCMDGDGQPYPDAAEIIEAFASYAEISPSGRGVKIFIAGNKPGSRCKRSVAWTDAEGNEHAGAVECYDAGRYFAVTGRVVPGGVTTVESRQVELDAFYARWLERDSGDAVTPEPAISATRNPAPDADAYRRCLAYLARCPDAISGQDGHGATLRAAAECYRFGLSDSEAAAALDWFNDNKCQPRWTPRELAHKLRSAARLVDDAGDRGVRLREQPRMQPPQAPPRSQANQPQANLQSNQPQTDPAATAVAPSRATEQDYVLIPGAHIDDNGMMDEVSDADFTADVISRLPRDAVYRQDIVAGELIGDAGRRRFVPLTSGRTRALISEHMRFGKWAECKKGPHKGEQVLAFAACGADRGRLVYDQLGLSESIRPLNLIVTYPVFRDNWQLAEPQWNPDGIYYDQPDELRNLQPETDLETIRCTLENLVIDFPFKRQADRENFFGLLLTPLIRPAIRSNTPLHLVMASLERTGKTLLVEQVLGYTLLGHELPAMTLPRDEAEKDKRILSLLMDGDTMWHLDNLNDFIDSASLATLLTSAEYKGRILGQSKMIRVRNNVTLVGTGNNVRATSEIVKRTVPIVLQPTTANPEDRDDFEHPDLPVFLRASRRRVLECLIGLVHHWLACDRPRCPRKLGGFNAWSETIGGILEVAGYSEWRSNERQWRRDADPEGEDLRMLVEQWWAKNQSIPQLVREVVALADDLGVFNHLLAKSNDKARQTAFGRLLSSKIDTPIGEWILRRRNSSAGSMYHLDLAGGGDAYEMSQEGE